MSEIYEYFHIANLANQDRTWSISQTGWPACVLEKTKLNPDVKDVGQFYRSFTVYRRSQFQYESWSIFLIWFHKIIHQIFANLQHHLCIRGPASSAPSPQPSDIKQGRRFLWDHLINLQATITEASTSVIQKTNNKKIRKTNTSVELSWMNRGNVLHYSVIIPTAFCTRIIFITC